MSADKPTVVEAMKAAMDDVQSVAKADRNTQQGYAFRGIDATVNAVGPAFRKHGIVPVPHRSEATYRDVQTNTGKPSRECTVTVTYRFYGPAGDFIEAQVPGESMDFGDKGAAKAMSVAYRICLLQTLCIPTDEPDPDAQSYERAQPAEPQRSAEDIAALAERTAVARQIQVAGHALGIDGKDALAADFLTRYGQVLHEASTDDLRMFLADLQAEHAATGSDAQGAPA